MVRSISRASPEPRFIRSGSSVIALIGLVLAPSEGRSWTSRKSLPSYGGTSLWTTTVNPSCVPDRAAIAALPSVSSRLSQNQIARRLRRQNSRLCGPSSGSVDGGSCCSSASWDSGCWPSSSSSPHSAGTPSCAGLFTVGNGKRSAHCSAAQLPMAIRQLTNLLSISIVGCSTGANRDRR